MSINDEFFVRFWGVRGSIPCPGNSTKRYGGNTSCIEIGAGGQTLLFDAGTGLYQYGCNKENQKNLSAKLFMTHFHYDHIWGWPNFLPNRKSENKFHIYGGTLDLVHSVENIMRGLLNDSSVGFEMKNDRAELIFSEFRPGSNIDLSKDLLISTIPLSHPDCAVGYKIEFNGRSICYLTDHEHGDKGNSEELIEFVSGTDIVIYDSTYTDEEYMNHKGWGHSTWQEGARLCNLADAKTFVAFHHDPKHDDNKMDSIAHDLEVIRPNSVVAKEGLVLKI
tara:strand:- start:250 stop:1083 length:834 start_codon:yes stop_codon:yes gene_type:complete